MPSRVVLHGLEIAVGALPGAAGDDADYVASAGAQAADRVDEVLVSLDAAAIAQIGFRTVAISDHPDDLRLGRQAQLLPQGAGLRRAQRREVRAVVREKYPRRIDAQRDVAPSRPLAGRDPLVMTAGSRQVERREHAALEMERAGNLEHSRQRRSL